MRVLKASKKLLTAVGVAAASMGAQASTTFQWGEDVSLTPGYAIPPPRGYTGAGDKHGIHIEET